MNKNEMTEEMLEEERMRKNKPVGKYAYLYGNIDIKIIQKNAFEMFSEAFYYVFLF